MRGNHIIWGRAVTPEPDATTPDDRKRIQECELVSCGKFKHIKECRRQGVTLGYVKCTFGGQWFRIDRQGEWLWAGHEWSESDPPFCLAILCLLDEIP